MSPCAPDHRLFQHSPIILENPGLAQLIKAFEHTMPQSSSYVRITSVSNVALQHNPMPSTYFMSLSKEITVVYDLFRDVRSAHLP